MHMKGKGVYKGKHWTQRPENREKLAAMARKTASMRKGKTFKAIARAAVQSKRGPYKTAKKEKKATSLVVNGWRITLGKDEVRIEHE
jgi:hypothetical protein